MSSEVLLEEDAETGLLKKKDIVFRRLNQREEERLGDIAKRKEETDKLSSETETTSYFDSTFRTSIADIKSDLDNVKEVPKSGVTQFFDDLSLKLATAQKFLTDSSIFISSHDLKQNQSVIQALKSDIAKSRDSYIPKKKFAFKNKQKKATAKDEVAKPEPAPSASPVSYDVAANEYRMVNKDNEVIKIGAGDVEDKDVVVQNFTGCNLSISGVPSAMHITNVHRSTITCGPCARLVYICI